MVITFGVDVPARAGTLLVRIIARSSREEASNDSGVLQSYNSRNTRAACMLAYLNFIRCVCYKYAGLTGVGFGYTAFVCVYGLTGQKRTISLR